MHEALDNLNVIPQLILVDGNYFKPYYQDNELIDHVCVIEGDNKLLPKFVPIS